MNTHKTFILNILWSLTWGLSVLHVSILGEPAWIFYLAIVSFLFAILLIFIRSVLRKKSDHAKNEIPLIYTLAVFVLLVIWLGVVKTYPEFREIKDFKIAQSDLAYRLNLSEYKADWRLARLYLDAADSIERIEPGVRHKGALMMHRFLSNKISQGMGNQFKDEMFDLAEVSFVHRGKNFSKEWYEASYQYGRKDALARFEKRLATP